MAARANLNPYDQAPLGYVEDERDLAVVVDAALDDYGLDPYEFRVYARIVRRAGTGSCHWETNRHLAERCGMSERQVRYAKAVLCKAGLVRVVNPDYQAKGARQKLALTKRSAWVDAEALPAIRAWAHGKGADPFAGGSAPDAGPQDVVGGSAPHAGGSAPHAGGSAPDAGATEGIPFKDSPAESSSARARAQPPAAPAGNGSALEGVMGHIAERIEPLLGRRPHVTRSGANSWQGRALALLSRAGSLEELHALIDYAFDDAWWAGRIDHPAVLCRHYDKLVMQMRAGQQGAGGADDLDELRRGVL